MQGGEGQRFSVASQHVDNKEGLEEAGGVEVSVGIAVVGCHEGLHRTQHTADVPVGVAVEL